LVLLFLSIHRHYREVAKDLSLERFGEPPPIKRNRVLLPIGGVHRGTLAALRYARMLSDDVTAIHISIDPDEAERVRKKWESWGDGVRLVILDSPYRLFLEPLLKYIDEVSDQRQPNEIITIIVPEFLNPHLATAVLHARTADTLRRVLLNRPDIVITEVPYQTGTPSKE
jgi:hypothetical protein